jgi:hypothetical protein
MDKLRRIVIKQEVDILALTELNKRWSVIEEDETIWAAFSKWTEHSRTYAAYNKLDPHSTPNLYGGTSLTLFNQMAIRQQQHGMDERGLGRWTWITTAGRNNCNTMIISAYCPCQSNGPSSVWTQHLDAMQHWRTQLPPDIDDPRKLFWMDLAAMVTKAHEEGFNIMLMGDFNSEFSEVREWMIQHGLLESIAERHGYDTAPNTHLRSKNAPIDAIFCSPQIAASKGGYLSFNMLGGDHRGLWIDIPNELLHGFNPPSMPLAHARRLKLEDPRVVKRYNDTMHSLLTKHNVYERNDHIHANATYPPPQWMTREYEKIDTIIQESMNTAEKSCRKFKCGETDWSPKFQEIHDTIDYWLLRQRYMQGLRPNMDLVRRLGEKLNIEYHPFNLKAIKKQLDKAHDQRRKFKKEATSESMEYRNQLAKAKEIEGKKEAATILRELNEKEAIRKLFRTIKAIEQRTTAGASSQLNVTNQDGSVSILTLQKEIEDAICDVNKKKYHQTEGGSQLLEQEFIEMLGLHGEGPEVENILKGTFTCPPNTSPATRDFLEACQRPDSIKEIAEPSDPVRRFQDFVKSWKIRKEKTVSANQHMGHYKACMQHPYLNWCLFQRHEIPLITGYSPKRFRKCIDLSILKKSGNYDIAKQRTLGLLDTEFNQMNKRLGHEAMNSALDHGCIATEQYSRPNRAAIDHALNRALTFDHFLYMRQPYCLASCDLEGCYDRIIHTAAALALRRVGVQPQKLNAMFTSIQKMVHKIRTIFGDSDTTYGGEEIEDDWSNFPQGILQGNACGPQIWSILSSIIFEILSKRGFSVHFCSSLSKSLFTLLGFSYVDDCDLLQAKDTPEETIQSMQDVITGWSELMEVTGGKIATSKSWWYFIDIIWKNGKWQPDDVPGDYHLTLQQNQQEVQLKRLSCNVDSQMLGIWTSPKCAQTKMIHTLREDTLKWASKIKSGQPSPTVAWTALHKTITARMKYSLPVCRFNQNECTFIMAPAIAIGLQKSGISKNFPTPARHAPITSGGFNVLHMYNEMGVARSTALLDHCLNDTPTGKFMKMHLEHLVMEAGLYGSIWTMPQSQLAKWCTTSTWIFHTYKFQADNDIVLNIKHQTLAPKRVNDKAIMDLATNFTSSATELRAINRVRMLHEVIHLSDLTTANGTSLDPAFLISDPFPEKKNDFIWPSKHHVTTKDFTVWRRFMNHVYSNNQMSLLQSLGPWIHPLHPCDQSHWHWFKDTRHNLIYERVNDKYAIHQSVPHQCHNYQYAVHYSDSIPVHAIPISVQLHTQSIVILNQGVPFNVQQQPANTPSPIFQRDEICAYLEEHLPPWCAQRVRATPQLDQLLQELISGTACIVSDGSHYQLLSLAGAGWIISTADCSQYIYGGGTIPGSHLIYDSYRSELGGLIGGSAALSLILPLLPNHAQKYTIGCDGLSAIGHLQKGPPPTFKSKWPHSDLTSFLLQIWKDMPADPTAIHIPGHQEKYYGPRTALESLNQMMDRLAKACAKSFHVIHSHGPSWQSHGHGAVYIQGNLVGGSHKKQLYEYICHKSYITYLANKWEINSDSLLEADWKTFGAARKKTTHKTRIFISKWLVGHLPLGEIMVKRKHRIKATCPHCLHPNEDALHLPTCPHPSVTAFWIDALSNLQSWLLNVDTHPAIIFFICKGLLSWTTDPFGDELPLDHLPPHIYQAFDNQLQLGWFATLSGILHPSLIQLQQTHYSSIPSRRTGFAWGRKITLKLWNIIYELWKLRCHALHNTIIDQNHGDDQLTFSITVEYHIGAIGLPSQFDGYFIIPLDTLLSKPIDYKKRWFRLIRNAREVRNHNATDAFTNNVILRNWVHLPTNDS